MTTAAETSAAGAQPQRRSPMQRWADVSLRAKITGVTVLILSLGLIVTGVGTLTLLPSVLIGQLDNKLRDLASNPVPALQDGADPKRLTQADVLYASPLYYVAVVDASGQLSYDNVRGERSTSLPQLPQLPVHGLPDGPFPLEAPDGSQWRGIASQIDMNGVPQGALLIAESTEQVNQYMARYITVFASFGIAVLLLGAALTRILVTNTFLPLAEVERTALEISKGDTSKRIMVAGPNTEVGHLGTSLNVMLDRLDDSLAEQQHTIERMRRFIGDAGHELRTPLVSVRGYAELYRMGALQDDEHIGQAMERIEKEAIRMTSLVEDLLALARLDERRPLELAPIPLATVAHDAALDASVQAPDREVSAVVQEGAEAIALGDEHKVRQLMTNLIGNALRHTPAGSPIEIVVSRPSREIARFEIVDHGEGVPEQIRTKIFDRFWRADTSRNRETGGSGLGLAIVRSIVEAHRGSVGVHETPGGGATFRVDLPAAQSGSGDTGALPAVES